MTLFSNQILQRVTDFIALPPGPIYVGFSGGPDSVALLHILHSLGFSCTALHCNFHLRDAESDRDEQFCRQFCQSFGIPIEVSQFSTRSYMQKHHLSLEMAARQLRYEWWHEKNGLIALGHHRDDSIETLLMNLMRGTGIHGLTGIVPRNDATQVVRPLLCLSRQEILTYLSDNGLSYVTDSTNAENDTLRNQIRNQLLPLMEQLVPQCRQGIAQTMRHLQGSMTFAEEFLQQYEHITQHHSRWGIDWVELPITEVEAQFGALADDFIFDWERRHCPSSHRLCRDAHRYYTMPRNEATIDLHKPQLVEGAIEGALSEMFDADCITPPFSLRRWREGDRMAPLGMNGHTKLISDLFQNAHYSPMQKATTWLVQDATGTIIWAIGLRMSELCKVTDSTTRKLVLSVSL